MDKVTPEEEVVQTTEITLMKTITVFFILKIVSAVLVRGRCLKRSAACFKVKKLYQKNQYGNQRLKL